MPWTFFNSSGEALVQHAESEATKAEMEAETAVAHFVPPDLVKNSPGVAKAWCTFDGTGTVALDQNYNISGLTDLGGTGNYRVAIATDVSTTMYALVLAAGVNGGRCYADHKGRANLAVDTFDVQTSDEDGSAVDADAVCAAVFGDA